MIDAVLVDPFKNLTRTKLLVAQGTHNKLDHLLLSQAQQVRARVTHLAAVNFGRSKEISHFTGG